MKVLPDHAGLREWRLSRQSGHHVGLYDGPEAGLDDAGGRWSLVCDGHNWIVAFDRLKDARDFMAVPIEWCEPCREEVEG